MDNVDIPANETVPLDSIAPGVRGLRVLFDQRRCRDRG
jgi:hypothetical protein